MDFFSFLMNSLYCLFLAFIFLISAVKCNEHHIPNKDDKWTIFVSQIQSLWKTEPSETQTESSAQTKYSIDKKDPSIYYYSYKTTEESNPSSTPKIVMNGTTTFEDVKTSFKLGLAGIISIPIVGIILLICCCYCCCKCCASMCESDDGKIIVMNTNAAPAQPQVILQQPIVNTTHMMHQQQNMQNFPPPNHQWGQPIYQPPPYYPTGGVENPNYHYPTGGVDNPNFHYPTGGVENPNFQHPPATAPQLSNKKY